MSWRQSLLVLLVLFASACTSERPPPLEVGAVYPLSGSRYHWVNPPAALAATNKPPAALSASDDLGSQGSFQGVFTTDDNQLSLVLNEGAFPEAEGQTQVALGVVPLDPATLAAPPAGFEASGNAYRLTASYRPSGRQAPGLTGEATVSLRYPTVAAPVGTPLKRVVLLSADGQHWTALPTLDAPPVQQVTADISSLGYVQVALQRAPATSPPLSTRGQLILVAEVLGMLVLTGLLIRQARQRRRARPRGDDNPPSS